MGYTEICKEINNQIHFYRTSHREEPNQIILGKSIYDIVKFEEALVFRKNNAPDRMFGIDITVDLKRPNVIAVGHMYTEVLKDGKC